MLGPNAQGEWRAAKVKLRLVNKQYAVRTKPLARRTLARG
jgi:hypothetical protein